MLLQKEEYVPERFFQKETENQKEKLFKKQAINFPLVYTKQYL